MQTIFQHVFSSLQKFECKPSRIIQKIGRRKLSPLSLRLSVELRRLPEFERDLFCNFLGFAWIFEFSGQRPNSLTGVPFSRLPAGSSSNPSLILRERVFAIETKSVGEVGTVVDVELVDEVDVCMETLEVVSLPLEDTGSFALTIA